MKDEIRVSLRRRLPTDRGQCQLGNNLGHVRYFIAVKPPSYAILCDEHYIMIRERLEKTLAEIWEKLGL